MNIIDCESANTGELFDWENNIFYTGSNHRPSITSRGVEIKETENFVVSSSGFVIFDRNQNSIDVFMEKNDQDTAYFWPGGALDAITYKE